MDQSTLSADAFAAQINDGASFSNLELHDADLSGISGADLTLRHCTLINVDLMGVDWEGLKCQASKFIRCNFCDANLEKATFDGCGFFDPDQSVSCNFSRARLRYATFKKCDLSACIFEGVDGLRLTIQDSNAIGAKFFRAKLHGSATLLHNQMRYADFRGANLAKCDLSETDFTWAALDEADLTQANLIGCNLSGATVRYTKLQGADLRGANLATIDLRSLDMRGAKILESQMRRLLENCELIIFPDQSPLG